MAERVSTEPVLAQIQGFEWGALPETRQPNARKATFRVAASAQAVADLGALAGFTGVFQGNGFNTIFRPQNTLTPTPLPNPAHGNNDNVLELNLTTETLSFSPPLGNIPNRGAGTAQADAFLNGVPYVQTVNDVTDPALPVGIHFEPGVWLAVPPTTAPAEGQTFARMASIPHGTTILAQGVAFSVAGPPVIDPVDITPFPIGGNPATNPIRFPSQDFTDNSTFRLPQDLSATAITPAMLANPNAVLKDRADLQNIVNTDVIVISTQQPTQQTPALFGGGTDNIAFLLGDANAANPNADAVSMSAIFWIEVVTETVTVPPLAPGHAVIVQGDASVGDPVPSYSVTSPTATTTPSQVQVFYTQIQYTQTVLLNFSGLSWPHVSVANLIPNAPVPITLP